MKYAYIKGQKNGYEENIKTMDTLNDYIEYNKFNVFKYIHEHSPNIRFAVCVNVEECSEGLQILSLINDKVHCLTNNKITQDDMNSIFDYLDGFYPTDPSEVMEDDFIVYLSYSDLLKYMSFDNCVRNGVCGYPYTYVIVDFSR